MKREKNWKNIEIQEQQYLEISKLCEEAVKRYKDPSKFFGDNCLRLADGVPGMLMMYNSLGKYQIQGRRKEQLYTKDKTALNVILSDCTRLRTFSQYVYGGSIFHS